MSERDADQVPPPNVHAREFICPGCRRWCSYRLGRCVVASETPLCPRCYLLADVVAFAGRIAGTIAKDPESLSLAIREIMAVLK